VPRIPEKAAHGNLVVDRLEGGFTEEFGVAGRRMRDLDLGVVSEARQRGDCGEI
jgi:hypothetical protein